MFLATGTGYILEGVAPYEKSAKLFKDTLSRTLIIPFQGGNQPL